MNRPRPLVLAGVLVAVLAAVLGGLPLPAAAGAPACSTSWGSLDRNGPGARLGGALTGVRAGGSDCWDRLVLDVTGATAFDGWHVGYVDRVTADPSGAPVPLRGGAFLQISLQAPAHTAAGPSYRPADPSELVDVSGYRTFRQVAETGDFEGVTSIGVGVRARLPFRVLALPGVPGDPDGTRVVLDVAHGW
jgi:hypothetical protein